MSDIALSINIEIQAGLSFCSHNLYKYVFYLILAGRTAIKPLWNKPKYDRNHQVGEKLTNILYAHQY
jgi:hypothetical protein